MRNILIYFAIKYKGDYCKIMEAIKKKEIVEQEEIDNIKKQNIKAITCLDENYPNYLKESLNPPIVLFYEGDIELLNKQPILAVVGSRDATEYGKIATTKVLNELFEIGDTCIISGMANGIDSIAHECALKNGQDTIAVLGCGIDICYPKSNISLYKEIKENGLIISEYPQGTKPTGDKFPMRNRIIAALSNAILVTDAQIKSGTQITVRYGLENNKTIMAIPHSIFENSFCNYLISEGACPIFNGNDLANEIL